MIIPIWSEQLLASLNAQARVTGTDDSISERHLVLSSDLAHNLLEIIVFDLPGSLPGNEMSELPVVSIYNQLDQSTARNPEDKPLASHILGRIRIIFRLKKMTLVHISND